MFEVVVGLGAIGDVEDGGIRKKARYISKDEDSTVITIILDLEENNKPDG